MIRTIPIRNRDNWWYLDKHYFKIIYKKSFVGCRFIRRSAKRPAWWCLGYLAIAAIVPTYFCRFAKPSSNQQHRSWVELRWRHRQSECLDWRDFRWCCGKFKIQIIMKFQPRKTRISSLTCWPRRDCRPMIWQFHLGGHNEALPSTGRPLVPLAWLDPCIDQHSLSGCDWRLAYGISNDFLGSHFDSLFAVNVVRSVCIAEEHYSPNDCDDGV